LREVDTIRKLDLIAEHCLAARRAAEFADERFIRQLIDLVLFELGSRLAANADRDGSDDAPEPVRAQAVAVGQRRLRPASPLPRRRRSAR
jgi:hypothetical protein